MRPSGEPARGRGDSGPVRLNVAWPVIRCWRGHARHRDPDQFSRVLSPLHDAVERIYRAETRELPGGRAGRSCPRCRAGIAQATSADTLEEAIVIDDDAGEVVSHVVLAAHRCPQCGEPLAPWSDLDVHTSEALICALGDAAVQED